MVEAALSFNKRWRSELEGEWLRAFRRISTWDLIQKTWASLDSCAVSPQQLESPSTQLVVLKMQTGSANPGTATGKPCVMVLPEAFLNS